MVEASLGSKVTIMWKHEDSVLQANDIRYTVLSLSSLYTRVQGVSFTLCSLYTRVQGYLYPHYIPVSRVRLDDNMRIVTRRMAGGYSTSLTVDTSDPTYQGTYRCRSLLHSRPSFSHFVQSSTRGHTTF